VSPHSGIVSAMGRATALPADERRAAIVDATLPLLLANGDMVTTRQIADAAGIAEGTIFRVFADKDAVIEAVLEAALDPAPVEDALDAIDASLPLEAAVDAAIDVLQRRVIDVFRLVSSVGSRFHEHARRPMTDSPGLVALLDRHRPALGLDPVVAARYLRAVTLSLTHPMLVERPTPRDEIARLFLRGVTGGAAPC
jgi:AcrR family transcriptional regulator